MTKLEMIVSKLQSDFCGLKGECKQCPLVYYVGVDENCYKHNDDVVIRLIKKAIREEENV